MHPTQVGWCRQHYTHAAFTFCCIPSVNVSASQKIHDTVCSKTGLAPANFCENLRNDFHPNHWRILVQRKTLVRTPCRISIVLFASSTPKMLPFGLTNLPVLWPFKLACCPAWALTKSSQRFMRKTWPSWLANCHRGIWRLKTRPAAN